MVGMTEEGPIGAVREGMRVVDVEGEDVGTVKEVRMSDPGAVTAGPVDSDTGTFGGLADVVTGGPSLSEHDQERLARLGYVRIDARGLLTGDKYAAADEIAGVTGDEVRLTVAAGRLVG